MDKVNYIQHVASPFTFSRTDAAFFDTPAIDGTKNVLNAAHIENTKNGGHIERFIQTSSVEAVWNIENTPAGYTHTKADWADEDRGTAYARSKIRAEKAMWQYMEEKKPSFHARSVLPGLILGPPICDCHHDSESVSFGIQITDGTFPGLPRDINIAYTDVRDVAKLHVALLSCELHDNPTQESALSRGEGRVVCATGVTNMDDLAFACHFANEYGYKVPTGFLPGFLVTVASWLPGQLGSNMKVLKTNQKQARSKGTRKIESDAQIYGFSFSYAYQETMRDMLVAMSALGYLKGKPIPATC